MIKFSNYPDYAPEALNARVEKLCSQGFRNLNENEALRLILSCIDLTTLEGSDTHEKVRKLCEQAGSFRRKNPALPDTAAVCVYPPFVATAKKALEGSGIKVAAVAGAFPSGQSPIHVKTTEVEWTAAQGADEIDMVISRGTFLEGQYDIVAEEVAAIKKACGTAHLKVILETGELVTSANIRKASELSILAGGDFIKTSTGKIQPAATESASLIMLETIREYYEMTGIRIGFKPAGGIAEPEQALRYLMLVDQILGEEWLKPELLRFGASRLAGKIADRIS